MVKFPAEFNASLSTFLPHRLKVREDGFKAAFESCQQREEKAGRKLTFETFCDEVEVNERVLRRARNGSGTLPLKQVLRMADRLGCDTADIVEHPNAAVNLATKERFLREMAAWSVPLRQITSWVDFLGPLTTAETVETKYQDEVLDQAIAPAIDAFAAAVVYAGRVASSNAAMAAAALKDASADLAAHGLHVSEGRYVARRYARSEDVGVELVRAMQVWIRFQPEDPAHVIDRTSEPMKLSDEEEWNLGTDDDWRIEQWLEWEGKRQLSLW